MVIGSLLFHSGIVLVGAIWPQAAANPGVVADSPAPYPGPTIIIDPPLVRDDNTQVLIVTNNPPILTQIQPTLPEVSPVQDEASPLAVVPEMTPENQPVPPRKPPTSPGRHATVAAPTGALHGTVPQTGVPGGTGPAGAVRAARAGGQGWVVPSPIYPAAARPSRAQGTTVIRVTTDASGSVASVVVVKSAGNLILDDCSVRYARAKWHGPANSTFTRTYDYRLP